MLHVILLGFWLFVYLSKRWLFVSNISSFNPRVAGAVYIYDYNEVSKQKNVTEIGNIVFGTCSINQI